MEYPQQYSLKSYFLSDNSFHVWTADEETQLLLLPVWRVFFLALTTKKGVGTYTICKRASLIQPRASLDYSTHEWLSISDSLDCC